MRLPFGKVWRAFPEFDNYSDAECRHIVAAAKINRPWLTIGVPRIVLIGLLIGWPVYWVVGVLYFNVHRWAPVPADDGIALVVLAVTTVMVALVMRLLVRDLCLAWALKVEIDRAACRKCGQSMQGVPVREVGLGGDPSKRFVRCPECGKEWNLLESGITPRDLVPWEARGIPKDFGKVRRGAAW